MKIGSAFGSYLKCDDLGGRRLLVVMERVTIEKIKNNDKEEEKAVLYFRGKEKGLVLNKTNAESITSILGTDETDEWTGRSIVIHPDKTMFGGKIVDCIRIAAPGPNGTVAPPPPPPPSDDDIPF